MEKENAVLPQIVDSVLGAVPVVGGGLQNAYDAWRQKNINMARDVLLTNVRQGDVEQLHQDQLFSMLARFARSVHEGIAKRNLILLARLITGIGRADKANGKAETFAQCANILECLTKEELQYLANFISYYSKPYSERPLFDAEEDRLQENELAKALVRKGVLVSDFEVWQEEHDDYKNPSRFPSDIRSKNTYWFSNDMQNIIDKYGITWTDIANVEF